MAVQNKSLQENVSSEMKLIMTLAVVVIFPDSDRDDELLV